MYVSKNIGELEEVGGGQGDKHVYEHEIQQVSILLLL